MSFMNSLQNTLNNERSVTENGAIGYRTTGKKLLDLNFAISSLRNMSDNQIVAKFMDAFYENPELAVKWLFYCRDVRGGVGERRTFRTCMKWLAKTRPDMAKAVMHLIPEYGRWDDLICLIDGDLSEDISDKIVGIVKTQLMNDMHNAMEDKSISLCAKWMPSENASSSKTKAMARMFIKKFGTSARNYRRMLSKLRTHLQIVEQKMSNNEWNGIEYSAVPSRANLIYNSAFLKHDEERRRDYLGKLQKGETKINSGTLFPHDIVTKYIKEGWYSKSLKEQDIALEEMWKALPDYIKGNGNTICVADGSGSMTCTIGNTNITALNVANALAIYFAERCSGEFKDKYITFSMRPQLVNLSKANSLREKIMIAFKYNEMADTNIEAVFDLILTTAVTNKMSQEEMPSNILILSDMEFNSCVRCNYGRPDSTLFNEIAKKYSTHGYKLPRLVFWNINSRTGTIPVRENGLGVALVSGFSPAVVKMVLSNKIDPFEALLEQLNDKRYAAVEVALKMV